MAAGQNTGYPESGVATEEATKAGEEARKEVAGVEVAGDDRAARDEAAAVHPEDSGDAWSGGNQVPWVDPESTGAPAPEASDAGVSKPEEVRVAVVDLEDEGWPSAATGAGTRRRSGGGTVGGGRDDPGEGARLGLVAKEATSMA